VQLAERLYVSMRTLLDRAGAGADVEEIREYWDLWDPDAVLVEIAELPDAATYRGQQEIRRWLQGWLEAFDEISIEPLEFVPIGEHVVVPTIQRFRSKAGVDVEQEITQVLRFRDGRLIYATGYRDRSKALEAAGARVAPGS
jgi:ketosteroid isomerase-like protein